MDLVIKDFTRAQEENKFLRNENETNSEKMNKEIKKRKDKYKSKM